MNPDQLLALLHFASPALPVGAFAYSQGLGSAVELGWVRDETGLRQWLESALAHGLGRLDLPILARLTDAAQRGDAAALARWDEELKASRETAELLAEEIALGRTLARLLTDQGLMPDLTLPDEPGYVALFALACVAQNIPTEAALLGYAWSWLENQVAVAVKAVPLGQSAGQRVLLALRPLVGRVAARAATLADADLGGTLPGVALASCLHETQYSRMFRS